MVSWNF